MTAPTINDFGLKEEASKCLLFRSLIPCSAAVLYEWHMRMGALQRLLPPWEPPEIISNEYPMKEGSKTTLKVRTAFGLSSSWTSQHENIEEGKQFGDRQIQGPFKTWQHCHRFIAIDDQKCYIEDEINYQLPLKSFGGFFKSHFVEKKLGALFAYRHRTLFDDITAHQHYGVQRMLKIAITGASGLVGSALIPFLSTGGHKIVSFSRNSSDKEPFWDYKTGKIDQDALEGCDAVIHLAGENLTAHRWTDKIKQEIVESRLLGTQLVADTLAKLKNPPKVFLCASAVGYYGSSGDEIVNELKGAGKGFLADCCKRWEDATRPASDHGIRVVNMRFGMILSPQGGALAKLIPPFKMGMGGAIGSGDQYISWIAIDDILGAILHALQTEELRGAVNFVSPNPLTNREFAEQLGEALHKPAKVTLPSFAAKMLFGEMADEALLASIRVYPEKLLSSGYQFRFPSLKEALHHLLGKNTIPNYS